MNAESQEKQDEHLGRLQKMLAALAPHLTCDRCRHDSIEVTSLWVFDRPTTRDPARRDKLKANRRQIASITWIDGDCRDKSWRVSCFNQGIPVSSIQVATLREAVDIVKAFRPDQ